MLKHSRKYICIAASFILLLGVADLILIRSQAMQSNANKYQKVVVRLGEDIHTTQANSTYDLHVNRKINEIDGFAVQEKPVIVQYRDPKYGFTLPPTILVMIGTDEGKVYDIYTTPQLELLDLTDAIKLLNQLIKLFDNTDWRRNDSLHVNTVKPDDLANYYKDPNVDAVGVESWKIGHDWLTLGIKRELTAKELEESVPKPLLRKPEKFEDKFLVEVYMTNTQI